MSQANTHQICYRLANTEFIDQRENAKINRKIIKKALQDINEMRGKGEELY